MSRNYGNILDGMKNCYWLRNVCYKHIGRVRVSHIPAKKQAQFVTLVYNMVTEYEVSKQYSSIGC
jgi:hypothetical protein